MALVINNQEGVFYKNAQFGSYDRIYLLGLPLYPGRARVAGFISVREPFGSYDRIDLLGLPLYPAGQE